MTAPIRCTRSGILGFGDNTSIWFVQTIGFEFRLIDFVNGSQQGLQFYLQELQKRAYVFGTHYLPHDAVSPMLAAGRTIQEQLRSVFPGKVTILPRLSIADGIAAARAIFPRCWFDAQKCADGLQALRHYRYETDEKLGTFKRDPLHDWASHPADAFRYFAVAIREPQRKREADTKATRRTSPHGWMS
jgi:phage terminase large subunit